MNKEHFHVRCVETKKDRLTKMESTFNEKCKHLTMKEEVMKKMEGVTEEIEQYENLKDELFTHANSTENKLQDYSKMIITRMYKDEDKLDAHIYQIARENMKLIETFQEEVKGELLYSKNKLEVEVIEAFHKNEQEQHKNMNDKIAQQKTVFDKMEQTKEALTQIKSNFASLNLKCEKEWRMNTELGVEIKLKNAESKALRKLFNEQKEYNQVLIDKFNQCYDAVIDLSSMNEDEAIEILNRVEEPSYRKESKKKMSMSQSAVSIHSKSILASFHYDKSDFEHIVHVLNEANEKLKQEYSEKYDVLSTMIHQRNEMGQLVQKCIDDMTLDYHKTKRSKKIDDIEKMISLRRFEAELDKVTFIFDNCINPKKGVSPDKIVWLKVKKRPALLHGLKK